MPIQHLLLLSVLALLAHASPARRDCGVTKTFSAENVCGVPYSGTWIECQHGMTELPTFTISSCSMSANTTATPALAAPDALITPAPTPLALQDKAVANDADDVDGADDADDADSCTPATVCLDAIQSCGADKTRIMTCFNTCTQTGLTSTMSCSIAPEPTPWHDHALPDAPAAPREHLDICDDEPYMCAPTGW